MHVSLTYTASSCAGVQYRLPSDHSARERETSWYFDAALRQRYSIPASVRGVVVTSVRADSDAGEKGLRAGDVIVSASNKQASTAAEVASAVEAAKRAERPSVLLGVSRGGRTLYVPIKIAD